jgi:hypothetical protein
MSSGEYHSCYSSYGQADEELARKLNGDLRTQGVECWSAPEDAKIGARRRVEMDKWVAAQNKLLLILSEDSVKQEWVEQEVEAAIENEAERHELVLFPIRVDEAVMEVRAGWAAHIRRTRRIGDFRGWREPGSYRAAFQRLLRDLKQERKEVE